MKKNPPLRRAVIALIYVFCGPAHAANQWTPALTILHVNAVATGGFVVYLNGWSDQACSSNPTGLYFYSGNNGLTTDGVKSMLAVTLTAFATGKTVQILYDNSSTTGPAGLCWVNNIEADQ